MTDRKDYIVSKREAAKRLGVSERTLDRMVATDSGLRKVQLSPRRVGFSASNLDSVIQLMVSAA